MRYVKTIYLLHGETELEITVSRQHNDNEIFVSEIVDLESGAVLDAAQSEQVEAIIRDDLDALQAEVTDILTIENPEKYGLIYANYN